MKFSGVGDVGVLSDRQRRIARARGLGVWTYDFLEDVADFVAQGLVANVGLTGPWYREIGTRLRIHTRPAWSERAEWGGTWTAHHPLAEPMIP